MTIRNKEEGNSVYSRLNYIAKQLMDPRKTDKEIKILKMREENLLEMLKDDQETFKKGGFNGKAIMKARGGTFKGTF